MSCFFRSNYTSLRIEFMDRATNTVQPLKLVIENKKHEKSALKCIKALVSAAVFKRYDSCVDADALLLLTSGGTLDSVKDTILATVANVPRGKYTFVFAHRTLWLRVDIAASLPVYTARICSLVPVDPEEAAAAAASVTQLAVDHLEKEEVDTVAGVVIDGSVAVVAETQAGEAKVEVVAKEIVVIRVPFKERFVELVKRVRFPVVSVSTVSVGELLQRRADAAAAAAAEVVEGEVAAEVVEDLVVPAEGEVVPAEDLVVPAEGEVVAAEGEVVAAEGEVVAAEAPSA